MTLQRRNVVCGGGSALFGTLVATLLGGGRPARAETIAGSVPEVDRVAVIPMHSTGEPFYEIAKAEMPTKLLRSFTGTRFVFSS